MAFVDVHSCVKLSSENDALRKKMNRLKRHHDQLQRELSSIQEKAKIEALLKTYVTTRDAYVQTEPFRTCLSAGHLHPNKHQEGRSVRVSEVDKTNKMLTMHSQLLQRYDKEVKKNLSQMETIADLNLKVAELERKLRDEEHKVQNLQRELIRLRDKRGKSDEEDYILKEVLQERNKLKKENKKLKNELKGLDQGFFEEIEDIKYAFQQSAKLNKEYKKALKKLCAQFGVPYPHPERNICL